MDTHGLIALDLDLMHLSKAKMKTKGSRNIRTCVLRRTDSQSKCESLEIRWKKRKLKDCCLFLLFFLLYQRTKQYLSMFAQGR